MTTKSKSQAKSGIEKRKARKSVKPKRICTAVVAAGLILVGAAIMLFRNAEPGPTPITPIDEILATISSDAEITVQEKINFLKDEEVRLVEHLMAEFPESEEPLILMADVQRRRGNVPESISWCRKALEMNARNADVYDRLAHAAFETDKFEQAASLWSKAISFDPARTDAHRNIARCWMRLGKYEEVVEQVRRQLDVSGETALDCFMLGQAYQNLGEYGQAEANYKKAVRIAPDYINAYYGLANVCARLKQMDEAREYLKEFKRLQKIRDQEDKVADEAMSDLSLYAQGLAALCMGAHDLYRQTDDAAKIEQLLVHAVSLDPDNAKYMEKLVLFYGTMNRISEALALCDKMQQLDPGNVVSYLNKAELFIRQNRFAEAEEAFHKAMEAAPEQCAAYSGLARLYLRTGKDLENAKKLAAYALKIEATAANYFVYGWACDVNGDPEKAISALEEAIRLDPGNTKYKQAYNSIIQREAQR